MSSPSWFTINPNESAKWLPNYKAFQNRYPGQVSILEAGLTSLSEYQFLSLGPDRYACRHVPTQIVLYNHETLSQDLQRNYERLQSLLQHGIDLALIAGSGLGYLSSHSLDSCTLDLSKALVLIENRTALIAAQFYLFDCRKIIDSTQIFMALGDPISDSIATLFAAEKLHYVPLTRISLVPERNLAVEEKALYQSLQPSLSSVHKRQVTESNQKRSSFQMKMSIPANLDSGRVWAVATPDAYIHTPLLKSLIQGFQELGWESRLIEIRDGFSARFKVNEHIMESAPDLFITLNSPSGSMISKDLPRPRINWILDHPRYFSHELFQRDTTPQDYIFYIDRSYASYFSGFGAASSLHFSTCPSVMQKGHKRSEMVAPIMFVGSYFPAGSMLACVPSHTQSEILDLAERMILNPLLHGSDVMRDAGLGPVSRHIIIKKAQDFTGSMHRSFPDDEARVDYYLYALANNLKRERYIQALLPLGLVVYGPDAWLSFLGDKYRDRYRGWLSAEQLPDAYASAEISLNIHSLQCPTCLNPRDYDILASGGLLLSEYVEDMDRGYLEPGKDLAIFHNVEELTAWGEKLLAEAPLRDELREWGYRTCMEKHTAKHRAKEILRILRGSNP